MTTPACPPLRLHRLPAGTTDLVSISKTVVYDKFDGGEFGTMSPIQAPSGTWTGQNVVVYRNGRIGPRPGVVKVPFTYTGGNPAPTKNGPLLGFGFSPVAQTGDTPLFFILEDRVFSFKPLEAGTTLDVCAPDLDAAPGDQDDTHVLSKESVRLIGDELYFTINSDQTYRVDLRDQVVTPITDSPNGTDIEAYRDRIMVATGGGVRVFYSAAADFDTWPVGNFFDVGPTYRILHMMEFRDSLLIFTQSGQWVMTGTPEDGTLRRMSDTLSPDFKAVVKTNDSIVYVPQSRSAPVTFNGSYGDERSLMHLEDWKSVSDPSYGVQSYGNRDVLFLSNQGDLLWRKNEAWTDHDISISGIGPWITRYFDDYVVLATPGSVSVDPDFYMLAMNVERPAFTTDTWATTGDNSDTTYVDAHFTLPDFVAEQGKEVRVRQVTVDFWKYDTKNTTLTNNISVQVDSFSRENLPGDQSASQVIFSQAAASATSAGVRSRAVYRGTPVAFGGGYRLSLEDLRGVAIERITVDLEEQDCPHS